MSEDYDKLDELFRNKFEEGELPVSDQLLNNIKQELHLSESDELDNLFRNKFEEGELPVSGQLLDNIKQELNVDESDKLDKLIRNKFEEGELPVSDQLLNNIKRELNIEESKRKFGFWRWLLLCLIVSVCAAGIYFVSNSSTQSTDVQKTKIALDSMDSNEQKTIAKADSEKISTYVSENGISERSNDTLGEKTIASVDNKQHLQTTSSDNSPQIIVKKQKMQTVPEHSANKTSSVESAVNTSYSDQKSKSNISKETKKNSGNELSNNSVKTGKSVKEKGGNDSKVKASEKKNAGTEAQKDGSDSNVLKNGGNLSDKKQDNLKNPVADSKNKDLTEDNNGNSSEAIVQKKDDANLNASTQGTEAPKNTDVSVKMLVDDKLMTDSTLAKKDLLPEKKIVVDSSKPDSKNEIAIAPAPKKFRFFIDINGGALSSYRTLYEPGTSMNITENPMVKDMNQNEKKEIKSTFGIDAGVLIKNKFIINIGLGIDNRGQKYVYPDKKYVGADSIVYVDSVFYFEAEKTRKGETIQNNYQFLRVPIMFGYRFSVGKKMFVSPSIGVLVNYTLKASSTFIFQDGDFFAPVNRSKNEFKDISMAAKAKLEIGANLSDRWSISLQPGYTYFFQSVYRKSDPVKLKPYSYDLSLAVRYWF